MHDWIGPTFVSMAAGLEVTVELCILELVISTPLGMALGVVSALGWGRIRIMICSR